MDNTNNYREPITTEILFKNLSLIVGSPSTIALYMILVIQAEMRYGEIITSRKKLMALSGIGSTSTYHISINKLIKVKLISYSPSFVPLAKSRFILLPQMT